MKCDLHDSLASAAAIAAASRSPPLRRRNPASRAPLRLQLHGAGYPGDAERRYRQSRHALGARRRNVVEAQEPAPMARPAPIAMTTRTSACRASRRAIPLSIRRSAARSIWSSASICAARGISRRRRSLTKATTCWRSPPLSREQSRGVPIAAGGDPQLAPFVANGRDLFMQRPGPAQSRLRQLP